MDSPLTPPPHHKPFYNPSPWGPGHTQLPATACSALRLWLTTRVSYPCGPSGTSKSVRTDRGSVLRMLVQMEFWMHLAMLGRRGGENMEVRLQTLRICTRRAGHSLWTLSLGSENTHPQRQIGLHACSLSRHRAPRSVPEFLCPKERRHCTFQIPSMLMVCRAHSSLWLRCLGFISIQPHEIILFLGISYTYYFLY